MAHYYLYCLYPKPYRVNSFLQNSKTFNEVFKCAANSKMNKKDKCVMW